MRGRVCRLELLLVLSSAVILGFKSRETRDHSFTVSELRFPFSSPPTTRRDTVEVFDSASTWDKQKNQLQMLTHPAYYISARTM
jgi:hypothetical protein